MWWCRSFSCVESDGVYRSTCTEVFCSGVYISRYTEANYPYRAALEARLSTPHGYPVPTLSPQFPPIPPSPPPPFPLISPQFRPFYLGSFHQCTHTHTHTHSADACTTCKRLRRTAEACCALGHHADDHIARRPQLQLCPLHGLPPCPRCTLKQRGVRHCCQRGHHKVCTPVPARRKRPLAAHAQLPHKRPRLQGPARISTGLLRSPHQPPTPPAPKRRRPKTPPPPSPPAPVPRGLEETVAEDVARPLFVTRHGRANTLDT